MLGLSSQIESIAQLFTKFSCGISAVILVASFAISWAIQDKSFGAMSEEMISLGLIFLTLSSALVVFFSTILILSYRWRFSSWQKKHGKIRFVEPGFNKSQLDQLRFSWRTWFSAISGSLFLWMTFLFVSVSISLLSETPSPILDFMFSVLLINLQSVLMTSHIRRHMSETLKGLGLSELLPQVSEFKTILITAETRTKSTPSKSSSGGGGGGFSGGGASGQW